MAITQKTIAINGYGLAERRRSIHGGAVKSRYTVSISAAPLVHVLDAHALGEAPAHTIRDMIKADIKAIDATASPGTLRARAKAAKAFSAGEPWATRRYSGGRTGPKAPNQSDRLFNDSGRLIDGIFVRGTREGRGNEWVVNVPANRFDPENFIGGRAAMIRMVERLQTLVPMLGNMAEIMKRDELKEVIAETTIRMIVKQGIKLSMRRQRQLKADLMDAKISTVKALARLLTVTFS